MIKHNIYRITWRDPESQSKWMDGEELEEWIQKVTHPPFCENIGTIVKETKDYLIICGDKNVADVGSCTLIYKSLITKKTKL